MRITKRFYIAAASLLVAVTTLVTLNVTGTNSQAMSSSRNCNADAIIECGAISKTELLQKYDQNVGDVKSVYSHYGISRSDISGSNGEVKVGTVYKDGRVVVDGETVATGAYSVSRVRFTSASTPHNVKINGTTYYEGPSMAIFTGPVDAFVIFRDGQFYKAVLSSCGNPLIAVPEKPEPKPVYACNGLTAIKHDGTRRYVFTASATAEGSAEIVSYTFTFGDGSSETSLTNTIEHEYASAGSYAAHVSVNINIDGETDTVTGENCYVTITVEEKPQYCLLPGKEHLPKDSSECKEEEKCHVSGKEHLPANSSDCVTPPVVLPKTGLGMVIGGSLGLGSVSAASYYWLASRRNLLNTLLGR